MKYELKETLIYIQDLQVAYDGNVVIDKINLEEKNIVCEGQAETGQIIAIVGRSGRGKSTLLKAITGLVKPSKGTVLIRDFKKEDITAAKVVHEGEVGFVDQKYTLFRHKTVFQACDFALRKSGLSKEERKAKIDETLVKWGLDKFKDKYPNELSGGQRQRTAIIEQLFSSDKFIVFDEPFSGLDVGNILEVKKSFDLLTNSSEHNTIIFTTHDIKLALELAQVIYVIGYPTVDGVQQNYGTVVGFHDLRVDALAWHPYGEKHEEMYMRIIKEMLNS